MKDPTRGGLASALYEMAPRAASESCSTSAVSLCGPRCAPPRSCSGSIRCHVANEGKAVMGVRPDAAPRVLAALRAHPLGRDAAIIGVCVAERPGSIVLDTGFGRRLLAEPEGEPLPRIC